MDNEEFPVDSFWDWVHDHSCGDVTVFFRFYTWFAVECPCCTFYRGMGIGFVAASLLGGIVAWLA